MNVPRSMHRFLLAYGSPTSLFKSIVKRLVIPTEVDRRGSFTTSFHSICDRNIDARCACPSSNDIYNMGDINLPSSSVENISITCARSASPVASISARDLGSCIFCGDPKIKLFLSMVLHAFA